jgi:hypothetical protein
MSELQSTRDAILLGIPMLGLLVLNFFRLDHLLAYKVRPRRSDRVVHSLSQAVGAGGFVCVEPDGGSCEDGNRIARPVVATRPLVRRVTARWVEQDCWD